MKYLANIINDGAGDFGPLFKSVGSIEASLPDIPTLVVGWNIANELYPNKIDVLNRKISDNVYWTYSKYERREEHEKDCQAFFSYVLNRFSENIAYDYFDIVLESDENKKAFVSELKNSVFYENRNMIYVFICKKNLVLGISKVQLDYFGYSPELFAQSIAERGATNLSSEYSKIPKDVWVAYKWRRYMIPVLLNNF